MYRTLAFLAAVALTTLSITTAGFAAAPDLIRFSIEPSQSADRVQLSMREDRDGHHNNWSSTFPVAELRGFDPARLRAAGSAPLSFALVREAGRFDCSGQGGNAFAIGECRFAPDPGFADYLAQRGIARPSGDQSYALAMSNVGRAHVEALAANHYPSPTVGQLVGMGIHGASPQFIRDLAATGYRLRSADDLMTFRIHGVDAAYIRAIAAAAPKLRNIPADDLVAFRIHGVSPGLVGAYARLDDRPLDPGDVIAMAIHGVTPRYIDELAALGYRGVGADELVQMRIFGVTPDFIRSIERERGVRIPVHELVQMRIMGRRLPTR